LPPENKKGLLMQSFFYCGKLNVVFLARRYIGLHLTQLLAFYLAGSAQYCCYSNNKLNNSLREPWKPQIHQQAVFILSSPLPQLQSC